MAADDVARDREAQSGAALVVVAGGVEAGEPVEDAGAIRRRRSWSENPAYWGIGFHYGAILIPIIAVSFIDGLSERLVRFAPAVGLAGRPAAP
jgi:hypothetical protein